MFIVAKDMYGTTLEGADGRVGSLYDILFDDQSWRIRHFVIALDHWFLGRQVLIDPDAIQGAEWPERRLHVRLSKDEARNSPGVDTDLPVARRELLAADQMLIWEAYWTHVLDAAPDTSGDAHLRSTKMLMGIRLHCTNGQLGHVADFLIDDQTWSVRDLVVDTRNWWPGKHVLIEPGLVEGIDWDRREIRLSLPREQVEQRPAYQHGEQPESQLVGSV
jgi:hypothetical protein